MTIVETNNSYQYKYYFAESMEFGIHWHTK